MNRGLGLSDGDLVLNHLERVAYIIKGGEPVKLANFGERSVLRPAHATAGARRCALVPKPAGRIYTTASLKTNAAGMPIFSTVAVNPETGEVTKVMDDAPGRLRVSPDGASLAYVWGDSSASCIRSSECASRCGSLRSTAVPGRSGSSAWTAQRAEQLPVWSPDGKQIILSLGTRDESRQQWVFETFRINADGTGREPLKIPPQDSVLDWSPDGAVDRDGAPAATPGSAGSSM